MYRRKLSALLFTAAVGSAFVSLSAALGQGDKGHDRLKEDLRQASELLGRVQDSSTRTLLGARIGKAWSRVGNRASALAAFQRAFDAAKDARQESDARYLGYLARMQAQSGDITSALQTAEALRKFADPSYRANAWCEVAIAQARAGDVQAARQNADLIGENDSTFKGLALTAIAEVQGSTGKFRQALETTDAIVDPLQRLSAIVAVSLKHRPINRPAARQCLARATDVYQTIAGEDQKSMARVNLIRLRAALGQLAEAERQAKEVPEPSRWQGIALACVAGEYARANQHDAALRVARGIASDFGRDHALKEIAQEQPVADAIKTTNEMKYDSFKVEALLSVARRQAKAGQREEASKTFETVYALTQVMVDPPHVSLSKLQSIAELAHAQGEIGFDAAARRWIERQTPIELRVAALVGLVNGMLDPEKK